MAELATAAADSSAPLDLAALCPHCLAANDPAAYFCRNCQTPMRAISEIDPIGRIYAMADTFHKAGEVEPSTLVLLGMIVICVPTMLSGLAPLLGNREMLTQPLGLLYGIGYGLGGSAIFGCLLFKTVRNYLKPRVADADDNSPVESAEPGDVLDEPGDSADL